MTDSLSDFQNKLYSIRPFIETESPPSSNKKENQEALDSVEGSDHGFKLPEATSLRDVFPDLLPIRKVVSQTYDYQTDKAGQANFKTITSISSTIDMLFSKIEKIKQQFSYALEKPQSQGEIKEETHFNHYYSEKQIDYGYENKENAYKKQPNQVETHKEKGEELFPPKIILHSHSLPLQEHTQNIITREYHSHPTNTKQSNESNNIFQQFSSEPAEKNLEIRDFELGKCIGSGKFGDVYLCMHKETGFICAIKKIFKSTIKDYKMEEQFATELKIHYMLNHPNIVKLYGHFEDEYHIFLMMEYASDGTLMERLKSEQSFVSRSVDQVLDALLYMHRNKVVHRDLKPENIVCSFGMIKVCDFGWASVIENNMKKTFCGTLDYVSPEMKDVGEYNESVDLWSVGVLTFELLAGFPPFKHEISYWKLCGSQRKMKWNWQVIYPPQLSFFAQRFIDHLLKENPVQRATIQECRCSYFIQKYTSVEKSSVEQELQALII